MTGCFHCGSDEHFSRNCPQAQAAANTTGTNRPDWCGECDLQTRLVDHGTFMRRCPDCHPKRHQPLPQHRRCGGCKRIICAWDHERCGGHRDVQGSGAGRGVPDPELASLRRQMGWSQGSIGEQS